MTPGILTRRLCGATLLAQALSVFFGALVAWRLAQAFDDYARRECRFGLTSAQVRASTDPA